MKKVIAEVIDRILEFDTQDEVAKYIEGLRAKKSNFRILYHVKIDGKFQIRIQEQYNKIPIIGV